MSQRPHGNGPHILIPPLATQMCERLPVAGVPLEDAQQLVQSSDHITESQWDSFSSEVP